MIPVRAWWIPVLVVALVGCGSSTKETDGATARAPLGIDEVTWPTSAAEIERVLEEMPQDLEGLSKGNIQFDYLPEPEPAEPGVDDQEPWLPQITYQDSCGHEAEVSVSHPEEGAAWDLAGMMALGCQRSPDLEGSEVLAPVMAAQGLREAPREMRVLEGSTSDELMWYSCTSTYDTWNDGKLSRDDYEYITEWTSDGWVYGVMADQETLRNTLTRALVSTMQDAS